MLIAFKSFSPSELFFVLQSSYRFPVEVTKPFDFDLFTRIVRQYPRLQLSDTVSLLLLSRVVTQMKSNAVSTS